MNIPSRLLVSLPFVILSLCVDQQAAAETLGAEMAKNLVSGHTWVRKPTNAVAVSYWSWKSDGTVCLRLFDKQGKCDDTGRWKMDGERVCYELGWWGGTWGIKSACFRVSDLGKGRYEALEDNGIVQFEFTVSK